MISAPSLDAVVIGYNEIPFEKYESFLRNYGEDSEAYRDLKFSFVNLDDQRLDYMGLLNHVFRQAAESGGPPHEEFKSGESPHLAAAPHPTSFRRQGAAPRLH